jgi:hypothetical protein
VLLEQSLLWLAPFACLMLLMVFAMVQFTSVLMVKRPGRGIEPVSATELRDRLLALNKKKLPYKVLDSLDCDLELQGDSPDQKVNYHAWLMLDDARKEVRGSESMSGRQRVLGMGASTYSAAYGVQKGYLGIDSAVSKAVTEAGWTYRPVMFRFQTTHQGARRVESLTPGMLRSWTPLRFWGAIYALTFFGGLAALAVALWPMSAQYWLMMLLISAIWWAMWGLIAWLGLGLPRFWIKSG